MFNEHDGILLLSVKQLYFTMFKLRATSTLKHLTLNDWELTATPEDFVQNKFFPLWSHRLYHPCPRQDIEVESVLTGFFNVSMPFGYSSIIYLDESESGLTKKQRQVLTRYFDEREKIKDKRIFYRIVEENQLVVCVDFFLGCQDDSLP